MIQRIGLTTIDNPFDQFTDFIRWFHFDESKGYHTSGKLARVLVYSDESTDADKYQQIEQAIDQLILIDPDKNLMKVTADWLRNMSGHG